MKKSPDLMVVLFIVFSAGILIKRCTKQFAVAGFSGEFQQNYIIKGTGTFFGL